MFELCRALGHSQVDSWAIKEHPFNAEMSSRVWSFPAERQIRQDLFNGQKNSRLASPRQAPYGTFRPSGAQLEGGFSLMAVMKSHSGSGERRSSRVAAEAEASPSSHVRHPETQIPIYLFVLIKYVLRFAARVFYHMQNWLLDVLTSNETKTLSSLPEKSVDSWEKL